MKILMTGATGLIGRPLSARLIEQGHELIVLSRDPSRAAYLLEPGIRTEAWDGTSPPAVSFSGVDAVIHLAGENVAERRWSEEQKRKIRDSRVQGLHSVWKALMGAPGVFISASGTGIYGSRGEEELTESSAPGTDFLSGVCQDWEAALFDQPGANRVRKVALRTGLVLSSDGGLLSRLVPLFRLGLGGKLGNGRAWMSWIHLNDLVAMYLEALSNEKWSGPLNAVSPHPARNGEFTNALARAVRRPAWVRVPGFGLRMALGEFSDAVLGSARVIPEKAQALGFRFDHPEIAEALRDLLHSASSGSSEAE